MKQKFWCLILIQVWLVIQPSTSVAWWKAKPAQENTDQLIFIAIDGVSLEAFREAQRQGLFQSFRYGAHLAPYPSMSDVSWNSILRTTEVFGNEGRLKGAEAIYFDETSNSLGGDIRDYYRRLAHPKYYMGAFDIFMNPYIESFMYFPTEEIPKHEIKQVVDEIIASPKKPIVTAFIAAPDSLAHTQGSKLFPVLRLIDSELKRLDQSFRERGQKAKIILVSDHGNVGRFKEGQPEIELNRINLEDDLKSIGFHMSSQVKDSTDVAVPLLALGSWAPLYFKNLSFRLEVARQLAQKPWFDSAVFIRRQTPQVLQMAVVTNRGEGELTYDKKSQLVSFTVLKGTPFELKKTLNRLTRQQVYEVTIQGNYPNSLNRLIEAGQQTDYDFPDLLLNSQDGFCFDNSLSKYTKMYRTHGSLSRKSSLGIVATNFEQAPAILSSKEILSHFGIDPKDLFKETAKTHFATPKEVIAKINSQLKSGVETHARDFSSENIFQHMTRFIADTRPYFVVSEIQSLLSAFIGNFSGTGQSGPLMINPAKLDFAGLLSPQDIGALADVAMTNPKIETLRQNATVQSILKKIQSQTGYSFDLGGDQNSRQLRLMALQAKRSTMKLYQLPYLLEQSLSIQEKTMIPETRDVGFANYWIKNRKKLILSPKGLKSLNSKNQTVIQKLFEETFLEAKLEEKIFPTPLYKVYNKTIHSLTIVYVPGIYNSIFDKEIFSLAITRLEEELGLRVIVAPVESSCSGGYNGKILMNFLKKDRRTRFERGYGDTRYFIFGYSKGAVDTLSAFLEDQEFVAKHIQGLLTIAAPLHGSSILDRADLPFQLVDALSSTSAPEICQTKEAAGKSLTPSAMSQFWRKNEQKLIGLTRYYSISFVSEIDQSHLFMRATKLMAQFDEDNDGVVTISSSHFPDRLQAVDLGVVQADHLAGILSAQFDQKALFQALHSTLAEIGASDEGLALAWNAQRIIEEANKRTPSPAYKLKRTADGGLNFYKNSGYVLNGESIQNDFSNTYLINRFMLPKVKDLADDFTPRFRFTENQLNYQPYSLINIRSLTDTLAKIRVKPMDPMTNPEGIRLDVDETNSVHFRMDHQLNFEDTSPANLDENDKNGIKIVEREGSGKWLQMRTEGTSVRMSGFSYRFHPADFPKLKMTVQVTKPVVGADVVLGGSGKDDSAFQIWFTLRAKNTTNDRTYMNPKTDQILLFGYYWGAAHSKTEKTSGQMFENSYSKKNYYVTTLPEAKQILIENPDVNDKPVQFERNFFRDLQTAFPEYEAKEFDVIAITIQHDSNDTRTSSEAYFKSLNLLPLN